MRRKICSILLLIILLLNSSVMTIISTAVDEVGNLTESISKTQEKVSMELSYTQLTNKVQNEIVMTGTLERDTEDDPLYENPVITLEMPSEVEKVVINDIKVLYDDELQLGEYEVTQNEAGNQVVKIPLKGKQTKYQTDGMNKGTAIRVSANIILKQDIKTSDAQIIMTCTDGADSTKTAKCEKTIKVVNASELPSLSDTIDEEGTKVYANGLLIENKAMLGDTILKDNDIVYEDEIIKYEVKITNTTDKDINNIKIVGKIPDGMSYVEFYDSGFWGDTREYRKDETIKEKEIEVGTLKANETGTYYYEVKVGEVDTRPLLYKTIEKYKEIMSKEDITNLTEEQLRNLRTDSIKKAVLDVKADATEDEIKETTDIIMNNIDKYGEDKLTSDISKKVDPDYEENTNLETSILINEEKISTYNLKLKMKMSKLNIYLIPSISRANKNEWHFDLNLNSTSEETLDTVVTVKLPQRFKLESVESLVLKEDGTTENVNYELKDNIVTLKYNLDEYANKLIRITARAINNIEDEEILYQEVVSASAQVNNDIIYKSNQALIKGGIEAVKITQTSDKTSEKLKMYNEIVYTFNIQNIGYVKDEFGGYTSINFEDVIPKGLEVMDVQYNDNDVTINRVDSRDTYKINAVNRTLNAIELNKIKDSEDENGTSVKLNINIKTGETSVVTIKARVKNIEEDEKNEIIENYAIVKGENIKTKQSNIITNTIYKEKGNIIIPVTPINPTEPTNPTNPTEPTNPTQPESKTYNISGKAWIDENENGKIDESEKAKEGLQVYLYDITNKKFVTDEKENTKIIKTDKNGKYSFEKISSGKYYVIIEYDSNEYTITDYQKSGVSELTNCDFVSKEVKIFKEQKTVGMTNTIDLESNKENIDIGLIENKIFDLKMEQYVEKITVTNSKGTKEYNYNNKKLAKVEIHSKQFNGSTVVIEYKIKVTNIGEISGNVNEIIAEIPSKLDFHSELNSQWSKSMTYNLSNTSYRTTEIKPGESIEATLVLSKTLDNDSAGTLKNITKIGISENAKHIEDNNKDNDTDTTEVIIGISTGLKETIGIIGGILLVLLIIALIFILIRKNPKIFNKKMFLFVVIGLIVSFNSIVEAERVEPTGYSTSFTSYCYEDGGAHYVNGDGATYKCIDSGLVQCSAGDSYTLSEGPIWLKDWTVYPEFADQTTGEKKGEIKLTGSIEVTGQSSFNLHLECTDTTNAPGDINIDVTYTGGSNTITLPAGGGSAVIPCSSGAEFILSAEVSAKKSCEATAVDHSLYSFIYSGQHTGDEKIGGGDLNKGPFESRSKAEAEAAKAHSCVIATIQPRTEYLGIYDYNGATYSTRAEAYAAWEKDRADGKNWSAPSEKTRTIYYIDASGRRTLQRLESIQEFEAERQITYEWEDSLAFGPENFPKKLVINKVDYDTGATLDGCTFSMDGRTFAGGETIDMVMPGTYTITEISAPYGYEYGVGNSETVTIPGDATLVTVGPWQNIKMTGNLNLKKVDSVTGQALAGVVFDISELGQYTTDSNGEINIYDILLDKDGTKTFTVTEIYNPHYGYVSGESFTITVTRQRSDETVEGSGKFASNIFTKENTLKYAKISGYVWEDGLIGKDNNRNNLYNENENDINDKLISGVKVILHDPINNTTHILWTNEKGEYSFGSRTDNKSGEEDYSKDNILLERANEYWVEFEYNGVKYRNVTLNTEPLKMNVSRASEEIASGKDNEDSSIRQRFNEKFSTISSGSQIDANGESTGTVIDATGNANTDKITYDKNGEHQSQINYGKNMSESQGNKEAYGENIYHITATTKENYNFKDYVDSVRNTTGYTDEIKGINLGLYSREQVDVAVDSDVKKFMLNIDGYEHTYTYQGVSEESFNEQMEVKLKELKNKYYERQLHESSIAYSATEEGKNLYADITYNVYLQNKSNSVTAKIKELVLDYDEDLNIISYGYKDTEANTKVSEQKITVSKKDSTNVELKEATLNLEELEDRKISAGKKEILEVTFRVNADTIARLVNEQNEIKLDFMAEISKYSTYANNEENAFTRADGMYAYASIDKNSAARNAQVQIDTDNTFVTDTFENDTTIAPTFKLLKGTQTVISGIVYEDSAENNKEVTVNGSNASERVGDGEYKTSENVMKNVLVELIKISEDNNYTADSARDVNQNQKQVYSQGDNNIAHLYKIPASGSAVDTNIIARTYTGNDGKYEFSGVIPGKYVIRFVYGKNMQSINDSGKYSGENNATTTICDKTGKELQQIEAREYKSTIIAGDYISKALNITNGKEELNGDYSWFLNDKDDNGKRYSDAVDDVEYRARLEKDATVDYQLVTGNRDYVYTEMQAHTPYFKLGIEADDNHNEENSPTLITNGDGTLDYTYSIKNMDFGIIERPLVDLQVDKQITGLKVSLGNGQVLINGNPQTDNLPYVRTGLDDFVPIEMDTEILHNATLEEEYTIRITNNSELDYAIYPMLSGEDFNSDIVAKRRDYYYYGKTDRLSEAEKNDAVTTRISLLGDYLGSELTADDSTMAGWDTMAIEDVKDYFSTDNNKEQKIIDGKYTIYTTSLLSSPSDLVRIGDSKDLTYKVSRLLSTTADTMKYTNDVEILQYLGYSPNKNTTPGNLIPGGAKEDDEDSVRTTITPPTGTIIARWLYVTTISAGLVLAVATIIFIKKKILVK